MSHNSKTLIRYVGYSHLLIYSHIAPTSSIFGGKLLSKIVPSFDRYGYNKKNQFVQPRPMSQTGSGGETIAAIATAIVPQQGSVGIVRLSGCQAAAIAKLLFDAPGRQPWESHRILYGYIRHPQTQQVVDEALLLLMLAPRSYTREDVVEFHCHGGMIAVQQVLQLCLEAGARLA